MLAPYVWPCPWPLDLDALNRAAAHVLGSHDFATFAASDPDRATRDTQPSASEKTAVRTMFTSEWAVRENLLVYTATGSGFLHHMVRNLVGTFVQAGSHRLDPKSIPSLLATGNRSLAGPTAPASGLFLVNVDYPEILPEICNSPPLYKAL